MLKRISHEILEKNSGPQKLVLIGLHTRGVPIANRIAKFIRDFEGLDVPVAQLDVSFYRDDTETSGNCHVSLGPCDLWTHGTGEPPPRCILLDSMKSSFK